MFPGGIGPAIYAAGREAAPLAVSTAKRSPALPDIPTVAEGGIPGYGTNTWNSLVAPRGTPHPWRGSTPKPSPS